MPARPRVSLGCVWLRAWRAMAASRESAEMAPRASGRRRQRPLDFWANERVEYKKDQGGDLYVAGVLSGDSHGEESREQGGRDGESRDQGRRDGDSRAQRERDGSPRAAPRSVERKRASASPPKPKPSPPDPQRLLPPPKKRKSPAGGSSSEAAEAPRSAVSGIGFAASASDGAAGSDERGSGSHRAAHRASPRGQQLSPERRQVERHGEPREDDEDDEEGEEGEEEAAEEAEDDVAEEEEGAKQGAEEEVKVPVAAEVPTPSEAKHDPNGADNGGEAAGDGGRVQKGSSAADDSKADVSAGHGGSSGAAAGLRVLARRRWGRDWQFLVREGSAERWVNADDLPEQVRDASSSTDVI